MIPSQKVERDWKYMSRTLDTILGIWTEVPDLRLGQLLDNAVNRYRIAGPDMFSIQDEELLNALKKMKEQYVSKT